MTEDFKGNVTQTILDRSLPSHLREEYPLFNDFVAAYYEWMQQQKNSLDIVKNLINYRSIDSTLDEFIDYFRDEFLVNIPTEMLADKRLLVKQIKNFYLNKGNEQSYKFLFRLLFNEDVTFYYPKVDILRASDGKWIEEKSLKLTYTTDIENLTLYENVKIKGMTSQSEAIIQTATLFSERGSMIVELILNEIKGNFQSGEQVQIGEIQDQIFFEQILSIYKEVEIDVAGSGYQRDDEFNVINSDTNEILGTGKIIKVTRGAITGIDIVNGGSGYKGRLQEISDFALLPLDTFYEGDYLYNHSAESLGIVNTPISHPVPTQVISNDDPDVIRIIDSTDSSGYGAGAIIEQVSDVGEILNISLTSGGDLYEAPTAEVLSETGSGAVLSVTGGGGAIEKAVLLSFPVALDTDSGNIIPDFTEKGDMNAVGHLDQGTILEYQGYWFNNDGKLSSDKYLQDNRYYQDFSYVLQSSINPSDWQDILNKIIHPAGIASFGQLATESVFGRNVRGARLMWYQLSKDIRQSGSSEPILI